MLNKSTGGNPVLDKEAAVERFERIIEPVFSKEGFTQPDKRSHIMINEDDKTMVVFTSAPSNTKLPRATQQRIRELKKSYKNYVAYVVFTRDYDEWKDKDVYQATMRKVMGIPSVSGVVAGISNITKVLDGIKRREIFYNIG
jgi:hypothetical protein